MKMNVTPLTLNDLQSITAKEAATQNVVLTNIARKIYQIAGTQVSLTLGESSVASLNVAMQFNGQNLLLGLSESLVNVLLRDEGGQLNLLNDEILGLIVRLKLVPQLPPGFEFKGVYIAGMDAMPENLAMLPLQVCLHAIDAASAEALDWRVSIHALPQMSLGAFLKSFDFLAVDHRSSPLINASIPMPLVAAHTAISAEQLLDLAIGDVILLN
jgi:hypothetical protein